MSEAGAARVPVLAGLVEALASLLAVAACAGLVLNYVGAHLAFLGAPVVIDAEEVRTYWVLVLVLGVAVLSSSVAARRRRARWSRLWHTVVALVGVVASLAFAVTTAGTVREHPVPPDPAPSRGGAPPCYSGSGDCVGG